MQEITRGSLQPLDLLTPRTKPPNKGYEINGVVQKLRNGLVLRKNRGAGVEHDAKIASDLNTTNFKILRGWRG